MECKETEQYKLYLGDCRDIVPTLAAQSVDAIITDIPYGTTACKWDSIIPFADLWRVVKHVLKPRGVFVTTASQPFTSALVMSNVEWFRCEWIWHKSNGGGFLNANKYPLKRHENIIVMSDGLSIYNPQMTDGKPYRCTRAAAGETTFDQSVAGWLTENDGTRYPTTIMYFSNDTGLHPTQKPVALYEYLVRTYTNEGETVLDITMGSGTTGIACVNTGRDFIGIEIEPEYYTIAERRMQEASAQIRMNL